MTVTSIGVLHGQQLRTLITYIYGTGSATEPDRSEPMDEATQNAQNWAKFRVHSDSQQRYQFNLLQDRV